MSQLIDGESLTKLRTSVLISSLPGPLYSEDEDITILRKAVNIYQPIWCNISEEQHSCENSKIEKKGPLYSKDEDITILRKAVNIYQPIWCNIPEEQHSCENSKIEKKRTVIL